MTATTEINKWDILNPAAWGVEAHKGTLVIDPVGVLPFDLALPLAVDCETDERDNCVGLAVAQDSKVRYFTAVTPELKKFLEQAILVGHQLKEDVKWLRMWGVGIEPEQMMFDTALAAYIINNLEMNSLKSLAERYLGMRYPTYQDMTGRKSKKAKPKHLLNTLPVCSVANYCGNDSLATIRLYHVFSSKLTDKQRELHDTLDIAVAREFMEAEEKGVLLDTSKVDALKVSLTADVERTKKTVQDDLGQIDLGSPKQIKEAFHAKGLAIDSTGEEVLSHHLDNPTVRNLLEYREVNKLLSTYIDPWLQNPTYPVIHPTYWLTQTVTTRTACSNPNLQNIPQHGERGAKMRECFIPRPGYLFAVADFNQIQLRIVAHYSNDPFWVGAYANNVDVHQMMCDRLKVDRFLGKICNFLLTFLGSKYRLMQEVLEKSGGERKLSDVEGDEIYNMWWDQVPIYRSWVNTTLLKAKMQGGVSTVLGRWLPSPYPNHQTLAEATARWDAKKGNKGWRPSMKGLVNAWERDTIAKIAQGGEVEIFKLATVALRKKGYLAPLKIHDEMVIEVPENEAEERARDIQETMENVIKLSIPIKAKVEVGKSWGEAKGK